MSDVSSRFWVCPQCGKRAPVRLAACQCGAARPELSAAASRAARPSSASGPTWFAVGRRKLLVMSVVTLGLYQIYWFYQHWKRVREAGENVSVLLRSIFGVLFCYPLFKRILRSEDDAAGGAGWLAVGYIALCLTSQLPVPYTFIALLSVLPLLAVQRAANEVAQRDFPNDDPNESLRAGNWLAVAAGGGLLAFVAYGLAVREKPTSLEYLEKVAAAINQRPAVPSNGIGLQRVVAEPGTLVYNFSVTTEETQKRLAEAGPGLKLVTALQLCRERLIKQGVSIRFVYRDQTGRELAKVDVSPRDCGV
jgi:hypothetical protein